MSVPRIAVTGVDGPLGRALVEHLAPAPIRVLSNAPRPAGAISTVEWVEGDLLDEGWVAGALDGIEVLYHLAGLDWVSAKTATLAWKINVRGARVAADAALRAGIARMIHGSSARAFDSSATARPIDETTARAGAGAPVFDRSKSAGEASVRRRLAQGLDVVILHPSTVLGPHLAPDSLPGRVLARMADGSLPAMVRGGLDVVDARDVATTMVAAADRGRTGASYVVGGSFLQLSELARLVAAETGLSAPRHSLRPWMAGVVTGLAQVTRRTVIHPDLGPDVIGTLVESKPLNCARSRTELGHRPRPVQETIRDTVAALRPLTTRSVV